MDYTPSSFPTTFDDSRLKGKSVLITGGASGLGAAFAKRFAEGGAFVTIADVNEDAGLAKEEEFKKAGLGAKYVFCDVTSWKSQVNAFKTAISSSPTNTLDTVVAAAGIVGNSINMNPKSNDEDPPEPGTKCLQVNLVGVYYTAQLSIYYMGQVKLENETPEATKLRNNNKSIILVASLAGYYHIPNNVEYTASKHGVRALLKSVRTEIKAVGLRLNIISPTYIETPLLSKQTVKDLKERWGVQFSEVQTAVDAVMVLATHSGIHGRSICVGANGNFDLRDDTEGLHAGLMLQDYTEQMKAKQKENGIGGGEKHWPGFI